MPIADGPALRIYMPSQNADNFIQCWCTRWDESNYSISLETFLGSANRNLLFAHVVPGAVRELYNILGQPKFIDTTYSKSNTLWLEPLSGYGLSGVREGREVVCKNISDTFLNCNYFSVKLDLIRIDN